MSHRVHHTACITHVVHAEPTCSRLAGLACRAQQHKSSLRTVQCMPYSAAVRTVHSLHSSSKSARTTAAHSCTDLSLEAVVVLQLLDEGHRLREQEESVNEDDINLVQQACLGDSIKDHAVPCNQSSCEDGPLLGLDDLLEGGLQRIL
eukprot:19546-Heterococcus_DN1.PRE.5